MLGAHTDSPCLKLKPVSKFSKAGYLMVNVETYGGGLWTTWFDRDLGLAGRVLVRATSADGGEIMQHRLVKIERPIMRIPMLAIHLQRDIHTAGFKPNLQVDSST
jgi:aspartyl aminopeptidase